MLKINDLSIHYGMIQAVRNVNFHVNEGEVVSLIGANGAGKTSILRTISGINKATSGSIEFKGREIIKESPQKLVQDGLVHVPEGRHIFPGLTVMENLEMGAYTNKNKDSLLKQYHEVYDYFPILKERLNQDAATLSGGEQQMLAMGRALMSQPKMLLLDEPSMGLAPLYIKQIFEIIQAIQKKGVTILLIEQNAKMALSIANRGYVLETGKVVLEGTGEELLHSEEVQKAYLGG